MSQITLHVNRSENRIVSPPDTLLLWALRDELNLTGTKFGCGASLCGACTVMIDDVPVRATGPSMMDQLQACKCATTSSSEVCTMKHKSGAPSTGKCA